MTYPTLEQFKKMTREFNLIPLYQEFRADTITPVSVFLKAAEKKGSFLLESVEKGQNLGRYSFIGHNPFVEIKAYDQQITISTPQNSFIKFGNPLTIIEEFLAQFKGPRIDSLPLFSGGAMGYFAYDTVRHFEELPLDTHNSFNIPDIYLFIYKNIVVYDHAENKIIFIVNAQIEPGANIDYVFEKSLTELNALVAEYQAPIAIYETDFNDKKDAIPVQYKCTPPEEFCQKVLEAKKYIKSGEILQVVISQRMEAETTLAPFEIYRRLRSSNPSPYMFYLNMGEFHVIGSSPETLVKVNADCIETCPIAGTRPRGINPQTDQALAQDLLKDPKERAEHIMLVDLGKNDISRVSLLDSIEVCDYMQIEKYSQVMHIVSRIKGQLKNKFTVFDALKACFPAGTVSGAPKVRAMEIIEEIEEERRGIYGGAIGYLSYSGNMDLCIAIRTILLQNKKAYIQAGAGIVSASVPEQEYQETLRKAAALVNILS